MSKVEWDKAVHEIQPTERVTPLSYTIKDAVKLTGLSRSRIYEELKAGNLAAKKIGRSTLIPHESIENWLKNLENYPAPAGSSVIPKINP